MMNNSFVFYRTFKDTVDNIPDENLRLSLYEAIVNYGLNGEYDQSNPMVVAFMQQIVFSIDKAQSNYESSIQNGGKGGAKKKYNHDKIRQLFSEGKNKFDIAKEIGCSTKTVERVTKDLRTGLETNATDKT